MKKKKLFVEPVLIKHEEKLDEITKWFNGMGSFGADKGTGAGQDGRRRKCPLGFK